MTKHFAPVVYRFSADGRLLDRWAVAGDLPEHYGFCGVAVDADGYVYVADGRVHKLAPDGTPVALWV